MSGSRDIMNSLEGRILSFDPRDVQDKIFDNSAFNRFFNENGFQIEAVRTTVDEYKQYVKYYHNEIVGNIKVSARNINGSRYLIAFNISYGCKFLSKTLDLNRSYGDDYVSTTDEVYGIIANFLSDMVDEFLETFGAKN